MAECLDLTNQALLCHVPKSDLSPGAANDEQRAVGGKIKGPDCFFECRQTLDFLTRSHVPDPDFIAAAHRGQSLAVSTENEFIDPGVIAGESPGGFARLRVPQ